MWLARQLVDVPAVFMLSYPISFSLLALYHTKVMLKKGIRDLIVKCIK